MNAVICIDHCDPDLFRVEEGRQGSQLKLSQLLNKIRSYRGVVILVVTSEESLSSSKGRLHADFLSAIKFFIEFKRPKQIDRRKLWEKMIPKDVPLSEDIDSNFFDKISEKFKLCGGEIADVVYRACATAAMRGEGGQNSASEKLRVTRQDISIAAKEESRRHSRDCDDLLGKLFI